MYQITHKQWLLWIQLSRLSANINLSIARLTMAVHIIASLQMSTPLSCDTATTNLIKLGNPVLIIITNSRDIDNVAATFQDCRIHSSSDGSKCEPHFSLPTASVMGKKTGHKTWMWS